MRVGSCRTLCLVLPPLTPSAPANPHSLKLKTIEEGTVVMVKYPIRYGVGSAQGERTTDFASWLSCAEERKMSYRY